MIPRNGCHSGKNREDWRWVWDGRKGIKPKGVEIQSVESKIEIESNDEIEEKCIKPKGVEWKNLESMFEIDSEEIKSETISEEKYVIEEKVMKPKGAVIKSVESMVEIESEENRKETILNKQHSQKVMDSPINKKIIFKVIIHYIQNRMILIF